MKNEMKHQDLYGVCSAGEAPIVQAGMGQVEMTIWLGVMALMGTGMLALLAMVSG